jgi:fructoselysine-6-P-deglycase FrlB-like protein
MGAAGCIASSGGRTLRCPAFQVPVVDVTSAGDAFSAGFLHGHLSGWELERSLRFASACGRTYLQQLQRLPEIGRRLMGSCQELGRRIAEDAAIRKFAFVGSGPLRGVAREAQLKIKEMVLLPADAYPLLDYRHGPKSNVDEHMLVTVLSTDRTRRVEAEFLAEMRGLRGRLLYICEKAGAGFPADFLLELESGLPDFARDVLSLLPIHFLAYYKSLAEGQSPSTPKNLTYWVPTAGLEKG